MARYCRKQDQSDGGESHNNPADAPAWYTHPSRSLHMNVARTPCPNADQDSVAVNPSISVGSIS